MNYKTILLTGAALLISSQAMAAQDITGPFAVPGKGRIFSDTSIGMTRTKSKYTAPAIFGSMKKADDGLYAEEFFEYGVTDQFSVNAAIGNEFDKEGHFNNDHNFYYDLGAKYNTRYNDVLFQAAVNYETWNPHDYYGHHSGQGNKWEKNLGLDLKVGLDLGNGITPYIIYHIDSVIDDNHRPLTQSISAGVHKFTGKWALDGAVRYQWTKGYDDSLNDHATYYGFEAKDTTETWLDASADYYLKDNVVLGMYGSYLIDSHDRKWGALAKEHKNSDYEVGLHVKFLF